MYDVTYGDGIRNDLLGVVFTNGLLETFVAMVVTVPLVKVLEPMTQKMGLNSTNIKLNKIES